MNTILIILFIVFIFSILMLIKSIHILNTLNNIKEPFDDFRGGGGSIEFFFTKNCSLCPLAKQKILKNLGKGTSFIERDLSRIMKKKEECDCTGKNCHTIEYEDYEYESDGKRAESLSISWTSVPVAVIQASSVTSIMYLTSDIINKL